MDVQALPFGSRLLISGSLSLFCAVDGLRSPEHGLHDIGTRRGWADFFGLRWTIRFVMAVGGTQNDVRMVATHQLVVKPGIMETSYINEKNYQDLCT